MSYAKDASQAATMHNIHDITGTISDLHTKAHM